MQLRVNLKGRLQGDGMGGAFSQHKPLLYLLVQEVLRQSQAVVVGLGDGGCEPKRHR